MYLHRLNAEGTSEIIRRACGQDEEADILVGELLYERVYRPVATDGNNHIDLIAGRAIDFREEFLGAAWVDKLEMTAKEPFPN